MAGLNWGIIGLGHIAHQFADGMMNLGRSIYAISSRREEAVKEFAAQYKVEHCYTSYEEMLADPDVKVVYIAVVNNQHYKWIMRSLECGKHVLCEKAIWGNYEEMKAAYALAKEKNLILAEAMTIFHMPLYSHIKDLIAQGVLGNIKFVEAELGSLKEDDPTNRFFNPDLGGGAMLDIGTYVLSFVTFFLEGKITEVSDLMVKYPTGVDEMWNISLKTDADQLGHANITFRAKLPKRGIIAGGKAYISVMDYPRAQEATLVYPDGRTELIQAGEKRMALAYEILDTEMAIMSGDPRSAYIEYTDTVVKLMDQLMRKYE